MLHKERNAIGLADDLFGHFLRKLPAGCYLLDHRSDMTLIESAKRQRGYIMQSGPRWLELGSIGYEGQNWQLANPFNGEIEQLQRRGVRPMCVLEQ